MKERRDRRAFRTEDFVFEKSSIGPPPLELFSNTKGMREQRREKEWKEGGKEDEKRGKRGGKRAEKRMKRG